MDMFGCTKMQGLLAASLYEPLNESDQATLDTHLTGCAACREESARLEAFTKVCSSGVVPPEVPAELGMRIRARIVIEREMIERRNRWRRLGWRFTFACGMAAAAYLFIFTPISPFVGGGKSAPTTVAQPTPSVLESQNPTMAMLAKAEELRTDHKFTEAYRMLKDLVEKNGSDPSLGEAQAALADIAFSDLKWYPEAQAAYDKLAANYPTVFSGNIQHVARRDMLAESSAKEFAPLYALDAARRQSGSDRFAQLEHVVSLYPATFVASLAAEDMCRNIAKDASVSTGNRLAALETVRGRCSDPIAVAQLNLEIGNVYWNQLQNPARALEHFDLATKSGNATLARLATDRRVAVQTASRQ